MDIRSSCLPLRTNRCYWVYRSHWICWRYFQSDECVAIGNAAGWNFQSSGSVAIGYEARKSTQGQQCIAIGDGAGEVSQGVRFIAIGAFAGQTNQANNSIVINASGLTLNNITSNSTKISPIRNALAAGGIPRIMLYDSSTNEVMYSNVTTTSGKTFVIDHPKDEDKYLVHACLEGPEAGVYYRGEGNITDKTVEIELPEYVKSYPKYFTYSGNSSVRRFKYSLNMGTSKVNNGILKYFLLGLVIFFWQVFAKRSDIVVELNKGGVKVSGFGPYRFIEN